MEVRALEHIEITKESKERLEKEKKQKAEACKSVGDYLVSVTNLCFDKCIKTDSMIFSKKEEKCVEEFFHKFSEAHHYAYKKFNYINYITENSTFFEKANDYGDYFGLLENATGEEISRRDFKTEKFH
jgi:hypothetical protein